MRARRIVFTTRSLAAVLLIASMFPLSGLAQDVSQRADSLQAGIQALETQTNELKSMMQEMRAEILRSRAETAALRQELQATREQLAAAAPSVQQDVQKLQEDQDLLKAKVDQQYQTKVESASRYRVRLSGMALFNLFQNNGTVDNIVFPTVAEQSQPAYYSNGNFGGSFRQSQIGLEAFGPDLWGARIRGNVQFDFAGGFTGVTDPVVFSLPRLRTGVVRLDWTKTSVVAGQDALFFAPLAPSSIATVAVPPLAYSGNLWSWIPQLRVEHRFALADESNVSLQAGILDPMSGDASNPYSYDRPPDAGEASRQPAYAVRTAWTQNASDRSMQFGVGGYYSRQNWGYHRDVDGWAATSDWRVPLSNRFELSGELYRGRAIGGLGGGIGRTILASGAISDPLVRIKGLNAEGGWLQVKFQQTEKLEWNSAFGLDTVPAKDLHVFPFSPSSYNYSPVARNRSGFGNLIYRPRSDLLLSGEFRPIRTYSVRGTPWRATQVSLSMGVLF